MLAQNTFRNINDKALANETVRRNKQLDTKYGTYNLKRMVEGVVAYLENIVNHGLPVVYRSKDGKLDTTLFYQELMTEFSWNFQAIDEVKEVLGHSKLSGIVAEFTRIYGIDLKKELEKGLRDVSTLSPIKV